MWYELDMVKLAQLLLPPFLRKPRLFSFIRVLVAPFSHLHDVFMSYRKQSMNRIVITGQVISLETNLNEMFFLKNNEIYITDVPAESFYMYNDDEPFPGLMMYNDDEESPEQEFWRNDGEGRYDGDFIVNVPSFLRDYESQIRIFLDTYKVVGRKYIINIYEYE
ncbi:hypothetical protein [uncultured Bacteroides sp.]|jgi:hypothetical protein|uniref:hypothetical protein n=1 Tax=uncultured Bacteroides sp. TaxID=162156 RepID=UPI00205DE3F4|nr:hypothetical protein [uncultured Bacteroides sp.]DAI68454.1 MAG TPA: hypothetical protein [Caudoviricetes sp.]